MRTEHFFLACILWLLCFGIGTSVYGQDGANPCLLAPIEQNASIHVPLWERFQLTYKIPYREGCTVSLKKLPSLSDAVVCSELEQITKTRTEGWFEIITVQCKLSRPGYYFLQPFEVNLQDEQSQSFRIVPESVTIKHPLLSAKDTEEAWKPLTVTIWPKRLSSLHLIITIAIIALLTIFIVLLLRKEKEVSVPTIALSPEEAVQLRLQGLLALEYQTIEEHKVFHDELSGALRTYMAERLDVPALQLTTGQIARELTKTGVNDDLIERCRSILAYSDLMKFTLAQYSKVQNARYLETTFSVVENIYQHYLQNAAIEPQVSEASSDSEPSAVELEEA